MIIAVVGSIGSGKTLTLTLMGKQAKDKGKAVLSNYRLNFKHTLISKKQILGYSEDSSSLNNCTLLLDEAQTILDCRNSIKNRLLTYFILQTRKKHVDLFYSTQQFWNVEKRLRENTDMIFECCGYYDKKKEHLKAVKINRLKYIGRNSFLPLSSIVIKNPAIIFKLYDSYEIVDFDKEEKKIKN